MEYLSDALRSEFDFETRTFNPSDYKEGNGLSEMDILKAHYILTDYFIKQGEAVSYGLLNFGMLASAVARQYVEFGGKKKWEDDYHRTATLLYGLTKDHAFHDGNKRTALLSSLWYLNKCGRVVIKDTVEHLEELVVRIAANTLYGMKGYKKFKDLEDAEILFIAEKLKNWTRKIDKRLYTITYYQLNTRLKQYGYYLGDPAGNYITLYKENKESFLFYKYSKDLKICRIGFPGWKVQVSSKDLHTVFDRSGLDSAHGIDSAVFFKDATPSFELLRYYNQPLKRLKDS